MGIIYQLLELFATFVEGAIAIAVPIELAGRKLEKKKNIAYVTVLTVLYTALITLMNNWQTFSFVTIVVAILFSFAGIFFVTKGNLLYKACAVMLSWFFIHASDYVISYSLIMIIGRSINIADGIPLILTAGTTRSIFIIANKSIQMSVFALAQGLFSKLRLLKQKSVWLLFIVTTVSYVVMSILTNLILSDSVATLQVSVILSLFFIVLTIAITIISISISSKYQAEKREAELMGVTNAMMEKNYEDLKHTQDIIREQVHDFKNHIRTLDGMLDDNSQAKEYITELLEASYKQANYCHSGNDIIDAIINCKIMDANDNNIKFEHKVVLDDKLTISPTDICAILANQIDNAIEACLKIENEESRFVKVEIYQKQSFVFFKVTNSANENLFEKSKELKTTKADAMLHGLGIKSITEAATKHNGTLKNDFADGNFISTVMVSI